jgi:hypothetical protein
MFSVIYFKTVSGDNVKVWLKDGNVLATESTVSYAQRLFGEQVNLDIDGQEVESLLKDYCAYDAGCGSADSDDTHNW